MGTGESEQMGDELMEGTVGGRGRGDTRADQVYERANTAQHSTAQHSTAQHNSFTSMASKCNPTEWINDFPQCMAGSNSISILCSQYPFFLAEVAK